MTLTVFLPIIVSNDIYIYMYIIILINSINSVIPLQRGSDHNLDSEKSRRHHKAGIQVQVQVDGDEE